MARLVDSLLPRAELLIQGIEDRMVALSVAANERWVPEQSVHDTQEDAPPVFGDEEIQDFLDMTQEIADVAMFSNIATYFGIPESVVNQVAGASLTNIFAPATPVKKTPVGVVSHQRHGQGGPK